MKNFIAKIRGKLFRVKCKLLKRNIIIKPGLMIYKKLCIVGDGTINIGSNLIIQGIKGDKCQYVTIDTHSKEASILIGDNVELYAARISSKYSIVIADNVKIEESGVVDTDFHSIDAERGDPVHESADKCKINIMNNVRIGSRSLVLKGVTIEEDAVIMPGSVVSLRVNKGNTVAGNPARKINS